jgi:hypothetical protein
MKKLSMYVLLLAFLVVPSLAFGAIPEISATVLYQEPKEQSCTPSPCVGKPLNQLNHSTIYFELRDEGGVVLEQWTHQEPATSPQGGGDISYQLPTKVVSDQTRSLHVWVSASNPVGESVKSAPAVKTFPKIDLDVPGGALNLDVTITIKATVATP